MTINPDNPQSHDSEAVKADKPSEGDASRDPSVDATEALNSALDKLFTEARKLMKDMKEVLRQFHEQGGK